MKRNAINRRNAGLRLLNGLTGWIVAGALALTGAVAVVAKREYAVQHPGGAAVATGSGNTGNTGTVTTRSSTTLSTTSAPVAASNSGSSGNTGSGVVVSGGS